MLSYPRSWSISFNPAKAEPRSDVAFYKVVPAGNILRHRMKRYQKALVGGLVVALGTAAYIGLNSSQAKKYGLTGTTIADVRGGISLLEAKIRPELRQSYLDRLIATYPPPMNSLTVEYDNSRDSHSERSLLDKPTVMITTFDVPAKSEGVIMSPKMRVYRGAFNRADSEDEFLSLFVDHEYYHAKLLTGQVEMTANRAIVPELESRAFSVTGDLFTPFQEMNAYSTQIRAFSTRRLSDSFKRDVVSSYNSYRRFIEEKQPTPLTTWMLYKFPTIGSSRPGPITQRK